MILIHKESLTGNDLKVSWKDRIGDWTKPLNSLLESEYMDHLITFINEKYKQTKFVYPEKEKIFNSFKYCKYEELKVVVISNNAPINTKASGIGFGLNSFNETEQLPKVLESFKTVIEETYYNKNKTYFFFDPSLKEYAEQGILFLNTSLTTEPNESHNNIWRNFVREVIKTISYSNSNIVFVFLNSENDIFKNYIDINKHYVLNNTGTVLPNYSQILIKIEDIILNKYGSRENIQW